MGLNKDCEYKIGQLNKGPLNLISDVEGVEVGHVTISNDKDINTGVTAINFKGFDVFKNKLIGASEVINGYGKTLGLIQLNELGTIETPILLTNTLSVGVCHSALVKYMLNNNTEIKSVNPIVCECNDSRLNDIRGLHVKQEDALEALNNTSKVFEEGDVGAGKGMVCFGMKGGIGSSSRIVNINCHKYTIGTLALTNFGKFGDLRINAEHIGETIKDKNNKSVIDKGSCIIITATDAPLSSRQLKRIAKRSMAGLSNTGSYFGNGSGDIAIAFSTANKVNDSSLLNMSFLNDDVLNDIFRANIESVEESIISSLVHAKTVKGYKETIYSLNDYLIGIK